MATDLAEILADLGATAAGAPRADVAAAADARTALSRLRPALERLNDDGLDTGVWTEADPDAFTRQAERVHWVRLLANTCVRLGDATPATATPGPMTRLADAAAVAAVLHADVFTGGQRWAIVAGLARAANHLVAAAGGGDQSSPDVDRALIIAEASSGVLFQFAALDPPTASDYIALHRPVPDPSAGPTSVEDAVLEASAALVHSTRPGTGPHTVADILAIATAAKTACAHVVTADLGKGAQIAAVARDAASAWDDVREQLIPFNDGSRRPQLSRPPTVDHALTLHRLLQPTELTSPVVSTDEMRASGMANVLDRLSTVAEHLDVAVADGVARGRFMGYAADLPIRDARVRPFLEGHRARGLVTADADDIVPVRSALRVAQVSTAALAERIAGLSIQSDVGLMSGAAARFGAGVSAQQAETWQNPGGVACPRATRDRSGVFAVRLAHVSTPVPPSDPAIAARVEAAVSVERMATYRRQCGGDLVAAVELYRWNAELAGALWETLGHVEVLLRNSLATRMTVRQSQRGRTMSWVEDRTVGLDQRGRDDVATAQRRVRSKRKPVGDGQVVSELSFGFWRFLLARRYQTTLWPALAAGFPHAPSRNRIIVEDPVVRLHEFRNRLAHQQRVWSEPVPDRYADCLLVAGFVDPTVRDWIATTSSVPAVLETRPDRATALQVHDGLSNTNIDRR